MLANEQLTRKISMIKFAGQELILDAQGAIYWPATRTLIVADLHLEKGSYFAKSGNLLPTYDTLDTLTRLQQLIGRYSPQDVICLGDNVHDVEAITRMRDEDYQILFNLCRSVSNWFWIIGNHDKNILTLDVFRQFHCVGEIKKLNILFTHEKQITSSPQIIGHYHPKFSIQIKAQKIRGKCFIYSDNLLVMPSFGTFTGGLDIDSPVFKALFEEQNSHVFMLQKNKIWQLR